MSLLLGFTILITYQYLIIRPQTVKAAGELNIELNSLHKIPQSTLLERRDHQKLDSILIVALYKVNTDYEHITKFYKSELADHGWKYDNERSFKFGGKDYGGKELLFSKDNYSLSISYPGEQPGTDYTFAIELSWGLE